MYYSISRYIQTKLTFENQGMKCSTNRTTIKLHDKLLKQRYLIIATPQLPNIYDYKYIL